MSALPANIVHFARLLRRAGLPVGPAEVVAAGQALGQVDIGERTQVRAALRGLMVHRHEHLELFDRAFDLFWRDPNAAQQAMALALLDGQKRIAVGNVTIPPNAAVPVAGEVIEARYLYAYKGGSLYQPVFIGVRDDIDASACTMTQLKFKPEVDDDAGV